MSQPSSTLAIPDFDNPNPKSAWEWLLTFIAGKFGDMQSICFYGQRADTDAGYWQLILGDKIILGHDGDFVQFDHLQSTLGGIKLPRLALGWIGIETGVWGPQNPVLFKKKYEMNQLEF
ncbi:hypothetical protein DFH28DRAFT_928177 [Melampsora americana]|nr:hypothetical protein DFH28DRAFT_928177 [Melampsora americana]